MRRAEPHPAAAMSAEHPVRLVVVNPVALNTGDAAILLGMVSAFREAFDARVAIEIAADQPQAAQELYPDLTFVAGFDAGRPGESRLARSLRRRRMELALRLLPIAPRVARRAMSDRDRAHLDRLASADAVVSAGGTFYVEHYPIRRRAAELLAARSLGTPTFLYTQSLGPFTRSANRRLMRRVVAGAERAFVRDRRSFEHLVELGIEPDRLTVRPDAAFVLARPVGEAEAASAAVAAPAAGAPPSRRVLSRVAISVRSWRHFGERDQEEGLARYRLAVAAAARALAEGGAEVTFLSTCQGIDAYWADDSRFARRLVEEHLPDVAGVRVDSAFRRPEALREELRGFDLVVATRMHAAILALCAGVPVVPIAYEFKTRELFAQLGMDALVTDIGTITPEGLLAAVEEAAGSLDALRTRIVAAIAELAPAAAEPAHMIREALFPASQAEAR